MSDSEKLRTLALIMKAIDDAEEELSEFKAEIKSRVETLTRQANAIRYEVLSGQQALPLEGTCVESDSPNNAHDVKPTTPKPQSTVTSAGASSNGKTAKPKTMQGQEAILPDKRTSFEHGHNAGGQA
jgi:hypothetical protein